MKKNILIVINSLKSGGAEKQSILLANTLTENYNIYFIVIDWKHTVPKLHNLIDSNINLIKLNGFSISSIYRTYKMLKGRNIEHIFTFLTMSAVFGIIVGKLARIPYVYGSVRNSRLPKLKTFIELIIANHFSYKTIHNSYSGKDFFKAKGMRNNLVIPNCYINILPARKRDAKATITITTIGRFVEQKDYTTALLAIKHLSYYCENFIFQIIGWGELENYIRNKIKELELEKKVAVFINPGNTKKLLSNSDIYLSTSLFEGTSNAIMEAMDESLPIVATDAGDNNRLVEDGINGYICSIGEAKDLGTKLHCLVNNSALRNRMGLKSNEILRNNYSEHVFRKRYTQLIEAK